MEVTRVAKGLNVIPRNVNFILEPLKSSTQGRGIPKAYLERISEQVGEKEKQLEGIS